MFYTYDYGYHASPVEIPSSLMALVQFLPFIVLGLAILMVIAWCKLFAKAGLPWERVFVPAYGAYWQYKVAGVQWIFWTNLVMGIVFSVLVSFSGFDGGSAAILLLLYATVGIVLWCIYGVRLAQAYGKGGAFALGLILLPFIFVPILGFGQAVYTGPYRKWLENDYSRQAAE